MNSKKSVRLGDLLVDLGKITIEQLDEALVIQKKTKQKLGEILLDKKYFSETDLLETLSHQLNIPMVNLLKFNVDLDSTFLISEELARRLAVIPIKSDGEILYVAMNDPLNIFTIEDLEMATSKKIAPVLCNKQDIINAIDKYYGRKVAEQAAKDFIKSTDRIELDDMAFELTTDSNSAPVVRLVDTIFRQALKYGASDIHIEPYETVVRIRYRIDGHLIEMMSPSMDIHSALVTRIKIMAELNIAEKRIPQDGRIEIKVDNLYLDLRISMLPTVYGEKVVIRILDRNSSIKSKAQLGFTEENSRKFDEILEFPNGIILVTGPTGSGKSTTLYTVLSSLNDIRKNIITVEDPVEYKLDGINQVQTNAKAGLTFAAGLRSILRQDPDIIMIGEIRDTETAEIAVRAAITGHLVISTIHTNDAPSTIIRLIDMGIPDYLVTSSVRGIVAQRLVRRICVDCRTEYEATDDEKQILGVDIERPLTLYKGAGCPKCHGTGYSGRTAIHEVMKMTRGVRIIAAKKGATADEIRDVAVEDGLTSLAENCRELVFRGITTVEEYFAIGFNQD